MTVRIGDKFQGEIIDFTHDGSGVVKVDGYTIFVEGALVGDIVELSIVETKKNFSLGKITKIVKPSDDRISHDFGIEESRGGIPLVEYDYKKQLDWKRDKVKSDLSKFANIKDANVRDTLGMDYNLRYRNHTQVAVGERNGQLAIGFYKIGSNEIVDMKSSILHPTIGDEIIKIIRGWASKYDIKPYNKKSGKGSLRHVGIRVNKANDAMVIIVSANDSLPKVKELVEGLKKIDVVSVYYNINKMSSSMTYGREYKKIYGLEKLEDYIGEYKFYLSPRSFFQVNRRQAEVLYNKAIEYLDLQIEDIVYDLYCGIGTISLYMAKKVKKVYGIEAVGEAVEDAKENARVNGISNVEFMKGKVEEVFPQLLDEGIRPNKIVLDPPRKGCEKVVLEAIVGLQVEKIAYVSCNPSTMARDVKYLADNGYRVVEVQPVDMFPHTASIECIAFIQREIM